MNLWCFIAAGHWDKLCLAHYIDFQSHRQYNVSIGNSPRIVRLWKWISIKIEQNSHWIFGVYISLCLEHYHFRWIPVFLGTKILDDSLCGQTWNSLQTFKMCNRLWSCNRNELFFHNLTNDFNAYLQWHVMLS